MSKSYRKTAEVDPERWARTYTNVRQKALKLAPRRLPKEEVNDAEDLFHDVIVRLIERGPDPEELERADSYVLRSLQNLGFDRCKIQSRLKAENTVPLDALKNDDSELPLLELPDPGRGPEMDAEIKSENERLLSILEAHSADLTKPELDLLALYLQDYTNDEIASMGGEDVKLVSARRNAVMAKIRYRLRHQK